RGLRVRARELEATLDVTTNFIHAKRLELTPHRDPLLQRAKLDGIQFLVQLRLPDQEYLDEFFLSSLKIREQSDFFQNAPRHLVRLVDYQDRREALLKLRQQKSVQRAQQVSLGGFCHFNA